MASTYQSAGLRVEHDLFVLRQVTDDLVAGYAQDPHAHRFIASSKIEIEESVVKLRSLLDSIERANVSPRGRAASILQFDREEEQDI